MGNDNPLNVLWTLITAKLFLRDDVSASLIGFNLSNSVNNWTIEMEVHVKKFFGFEENVRLEHHITETNKNIVIQSYDRLLELLEVARKVKNISEKHERGIPEV
jgi:hypothetical protein